MHPSTDRKPTTPSDTIWADPNLFRTRAGLPKSKYKFLDRIKILAGKHNLQATIDRFCDFRDLFAFRETNAIITEKGQGPRAWTELRGTLHQSRIAEHLLAGIVPNCPPTWIGTRSFKTSMYLLIDVDAEPEQNYTLDELATIGNADAKRSQRGRHSRHDSNPS